MASHKIEAFSVNGSHRLRLSPLVKQTPLPIDPLGSDIFDEEDDELLKALFGNIPITPPIEIDTEHLRVTQLDDKLMVVIKSPKLIKVKQEVIPLKPTPISVPVPKIKKKVRPKHSHNRHMIHTMPTQPDFIDTNIDQYDDDEDLVEALVTLTLIDPVSGTQMVTPLRSKNCSHNECFDYDSFLLMNHLKPFKIVVRRYSNATRYPGEVNVMAILQDSKRPPKSSKEFNKVTVQYDYKYKMKQLADKNKVYNELGYFCCPICNLEFDINQPGEVYVVGELSDLIQDVKLEENQEEIENIEIDMINKGKWRWVRRENERKEHIERQIETHQIELVTLDSEDEDFDPQSIKVDSPPPNLEASSGSVLANSFAPVLPPLPPPQPQSIALSPLQPLPPLLPERQRPPPPVLPDSPNDLPGDVDATVDDLLNLGEYDAEPGVFMGDFPLPASPDAAETEKVDSTNYHRGVVSFRASEYLPVEAQGDFDDPIVLD